MELQFAKKYQIFFEIIGSHYDYEEFDTINEAKKFGESLPAEVKWYPTKRVNGKFVERVEESEWVDADDALQSMGGQANLKKHGPEFYKKIQERSVAKRKENKEKRQNTNENKGE